MSLLWFFEVAKFLEEFFSHWVKEQGELNIDSSES